MTRLLAWLVAVVALAGCTGSRVTTPLDPFSRTTIEPPRTGWITGQPAADPYYSGTRQAAVPPSTSPGSTPKAAAPPTTQSSGNRNTPPGGHNYRVGSSEQPRTVEPAAPGDRIRIPVAARKAPERSGAILASQERVVGTIQPRPGGSAQSSYRQSPPGGVGSAEGQRRRVGVPEGTIDIMDLPPVGSTSTTQMPSGSSEIQLVSGTEELDDSSASTRPASRTSTTIPGGEGVDSFSPRPRYAYDPDYRWLKGRLEYSHIDRRWKLRYIPIDGTTDQFGGSVVLSNPSLLSGYERGEFVEVHGALGNAADDNDRGYAPEYEIRQIRRLES